MDSSELHDMLFVWPHTEPKTVILTGTFDQWSGSIHLEKTPTGFEGKVKIPWGEKIKYKFIVDGQWIVHEDQPTEADERGLINNVYTSPPKPAPLAMEAPPAVLPSEVVNPALKANEEPKFTAPGLPSKIATLVDQIPTTITSAPSVVAEVAVSSAIKAKEVINEAADKITTSSGSTRAVTKAKDDVNAPKTEVLNPTSEQNNKIAPATGFPQLISNLASTIVAADGTSSAFEYVTSGIGAAIHSVTGVDPLNKGQIAIPTPKVDSEFIIPNEIPSNPSEASEPQVVGVQPVVEQHATSPIVPDISMPIVPVNAPENNTVGLDDLSSPSKSAQVSLPITSSSVISTTEGSAAPPEEQSTHGPIVADIPNGVKRAPIVEASVPTETLATEPKVEALITPQVKDDSSSIVATDKKLEESLTEPVPAEVPKPTEVISGPTEVEISEPTKVHQPTEVEVSKPTEIEISEPTDAPQPTEAEVSKPTEIEVSNPTKVAERIPDMVVTPITGGTVEPAVEASAVSSTNGTSKDALTNGHSTISPVPLEDKAAVVAPPIINTPSTPTKKVTPPSTPTKKAFPTSDSPSISPSSSKMGTTSSRKKRQSIFGKVKNLFHHHKDNQE